MEVKDWIWSFAGVIIFYIGFYLGCRKGKRDLQINMMIATLEARNEKKVSLDQPLTVEQVDKILGHYEIFDVREKLIIKNKLLDAGIMKDKQ